MKKGLIGKKIGMTQIFDEAGNVIPVTVVEAGIRSAGGVAAVTGTFLRGGKFPSSIAPVGHSTTHLRQSLHNSASI